MIHTIRIPKDFDSIATKRFREKRKREFNAAKSHFGDPLKSRTFIFECYKDANIKRALVRLFNGKCAYCDSNVTHITSGDVEHFRPKSMYWWLASDWHNLLFACEKCNRSAKKDCFPLLNDEPYCTFGNEAAFSKEESDLRLLLNPCKENPEEYFEYDERMAVIAPKLTSAGKQRLMANTSIEVYKLQRVELVEERQKVLILLLAQIEYTRKAILAYNQVYSYSKNVRKEYEERMKKEIIALLEYNRPKRQYLGMVRQILRKFFQENNLPLPSSLA